MIFTWVKQGTGKGKHSDKDWLSPTVKGGCRCIYKGVPGMDLKNQRFFYRPLLQNWNQGCLCISSFPFSCTTETKKVLCCCATHPLFFVQWNEHAWRALIKSSPGKWLSLLAFSASIMFVVFFFLSQTDPSEPWGHLHTTLPLETCM